MVKLQPSPNQLHFAVTPPDRTLNDPPRRLSPSRTAAIYARRSFQNGASAQTTFPSGFTARS
jgi:hypothetical protein